MTVMTRIAYGFETGRDDAVWRQRAACRDWPLDWWTHSNASVRGRAVWICNRRCPVRADCAAWARANVQLCDGAVYGGVYYSRSGRAEQGPVRPAKHQPEPTPPWVALTLRQQQAGG